ncbi:MAG: NAD-dependent deacylase [Acidobacteria bacterium]|nr:NAD-dependent deacylase [Acidobacteriota bacterium]
MGAPARVVPALERFGGDRRRGARDAPRPEGAPRGVGDRGRLHGALPRAARDGRQRGGNTPRRLRPPRARWEGARPRRPSHVEISPRGSVDARPDDDRAHRPRDDGDQGRHRNRRRARRAVPLRRALTPRPSPRRGRRGAGRGACEASGPAGFGRARRDIEGRVRTGGHAVGNGAAAEAGRGAPDDHATDLEPRRQEGRRIRRRALRDSRRLSLARPRPNRSRGRTVSSEGLGGLAALVPDLLAGRPLAVLTGAGVSAESGLPTFRGPDGMWEGRRAVELTTPEAFAANPKEVWRFYEWRRAKLREARPNAGHVALARMENVIPRMTLVTQNVDGLHRAAGSRNLIELHGTILKTRCTGCGANETGPDAPFPEIPPRCACGGLLRPDVVWFGEMLPEGAFEAAAEAASDSAVFLVVGTSSVVAPASSLATIAARGGAKVFEINPMMTPLASSADGCLRANASAVLPVLADALERGTA